VIILATISILFFFVIIGLTVWSMIEDRRKTKAYNKYFEGKKKERDAWMNEF
jgi:heme/copper-type cytochrome/quinol oxidase subunit 2